LYVCCYPFSPLIPVAVYTDQDLEVPLTWEESDPKYIANAAEVKLRSFSTDIHKVDTAVACVARNTRLGRLSCSFCGVLVGLAGKMRAWRSL
jgi:hypothetical protein